MIAAAIGDWSAVDGLPKAHRSGTHRTVAPADTVARVRHLMPLMGITRLANITGLDCIGIPVVVATRPNSRSLAVSQGKGQSLDAARASALMESVEAYHAERITQPLKLASLEELWYTHRVVDVSRLPRSSERTFDRDLPVLWIEGDELLGERRTWVPYELVHTNYTDTGRIGAGRFQTSSNGLASGNDRQEALSHALCEVIERDASTLWDRLPHEAQEERRIDLDTVDDAGCRDLLRRYEEADVTVGVWDATSDIGVASFVCMIVDRVDNPLRLLYPTAGMGCHPTRAVALSRALSEAAQSRLTVIAGSRDDVTRAEYERYRHPDALDQIRARLTSAGGTRCFHAVPSFEHETVGGDIVHILARLRRGGIDEVADDPDHPVAWNVVGAELRRLYGQLVPEVAARARALAWHERWLNADSPAVVPNPAAEHVHAAVVARASHIQVVRLRGPGALVEEETDLIRELRRTVDRRS